MMYKFNGFTEKANKALNLSIETASALGHTYIGSEHLLIGLLKEGSGVAAAVLQSAGASAEMIEDMLVATVGRGSPTSLTPDDMTPRAKRIIELSIVGARGSGADLVGTEHLLAAIIQEGDNYAVRFLSQAKVNLRQVMGEVNGGENASAPGEAPAQRKNGVKTPTLDQFGRDLTEE